MTQKVTPDISLVPRHRGRGGERAPDTLFAHVLNRHKILWQLCLHVYIRILVTLKLASWCTVPVSFILCCLGN